MRQVLIMLALATAASGRLIPAQTQQFSTHLQEYGWQPAKLRMSSGEREIAATRHLDFDSAGKLYVGFAVEGKNKLLKPGEANNIFRVLTIDQESGEVKQTLDFATQSKERVGVNVSASDALLITANDKVQIVSKDGSSRMVFDIPVPAGNHILVIRESASRKTLLLSINDLNTHYFLQSDTLSLITKCYTPPPPLPTRDHPGVNFSNKHEPGTFSDNIQIRLAHTTQLGPPYELVKGPLCGEAEDLWSLGTNVIEPILLDDSTVLELGTSKLDVNTSVFDVRKTNGELVWAEELPKHFLADTLTLGPARTADGSRFAVEIVELRGGSQEFDISPKTVSMGVWIYDARTGKQVGSIKYPKLGPYEFALSPDGSRVAILSVDGGIVEVWKLPGS
jgi:WD40 repeat protein